MPNATGHQDAARSVVFAPLDGTGRAELVEQRLTDAIVSGVLRDGERLPSESELSRSLGVALVTAREALEGMRERGLVRTRRGRDGGSFVTYDRDAAARLLETRVRGHSRIELRDLALHVSAIAGTSGIAALRWRLLTPSARSLPVLMCASPDVMAEKPNSVSPLTIATTTGAEPL